MPSRRPVRSALPVAFGLSVVVAVGFADTAVALAKPTTTVARHTTAAAPGPVPKPGHVALLPPTTAVLTEPVSATSAGVTLFGPAGPASRTGIGAHAPTLPHTL